MGESQLFSRPRTPLFLRVKHQQTSDKRPIDSRQISTSRTTRTLNDGPQSPNFTKKQHNNECGLDALCNDGHNTNLLPSSSTPKVKLRINNNESEMVKKNLTISQMCNFYRAAGISTIEQNMRQQQGTSMPFRSFRNTNNVNNSQVRPVRKFNNHIVQGRYNLPDSNRSSCDDKSSVGRNKKEQTMFFRDESLKRIQQASSVYLEDNRVFHEQRMKRIEKSINYQQKVTFERQLTETKKEFTQQLKRNITNLAELKKVRNRYWKEKQKRVNNTYVSVAALEMPEVDRYAYGLPAEGKEYTLINHKKSSEAKEMLKKKWESSKKKATAIVKMLDMTKKLQKSRTLPLLKPLTSNVNSRKGKRNKSEEDSRESTTNERLKTITPFIDVSSEISSIQEDSEFELESEDL